MQQKHQIKTINLLKPPRLRHLLVVGAPQALTVVTRVAIAELKLHKDGEEYEMGKLGDST